MGRRANHSSRTLTAAFTVLIAAPICIGATHTIIGIQKDIAAARLRLAPKTDTHKSTDRATPDIFDDLSREQTTKPNPTTETPLPKSHSGNAKLTWHIEPGRGLDHDIGFMNESFGIHDVVVELVEDGFITKLATITLNPRARVSLKLAPGRYRLLAATGTSTPIMFATVSFQEARKAKMPPIAIITTDGNATLVSGIQATPKPEKKEAAEVDTPAIPTDSTTDETASEEPSWY